ncbi:zinc ribbon domain-containing protein [bacterium]|nr:zinc ribbon domain-containing protein [bacterium]MBU1651554.1 zinc ribbon domain-containing protein [bacterium]
MPTYEYLCDDCEFKFEEFQSIAAEPVHICPRCCGHVHRLISGGGGIIFRGSGFYETDYKKRHFSEPSPVSSSDVKDAVSSISSSDAKKSDTEKADN